MLARIAPGADCNWSAIVHRTKVKPYFGPVRSSVESQAEPDDSMLKLLLKTEREMQPRAPVVALLQFNLYIDARREVELHQLVDRLVGGIDDVHQAQVRADLELIA